MGKHVPFPTVPITEENTMWDALNPPGPSGPTRRSAEVAEEQTGMGFGFSFLLQSATVSMLLTHPAS